MREDLKDKLVELKNASPLEVTRILEECELYDRESSQKVIDDVYKEFENGDNTVKNVVKPVFMSVVDGLLEGTKFGRASRKKGLTASRVIDECESFSYDGEFDNSTNINGYTEYKNARDFTEAYGQNSKYARKDYENQNAMAKYKNKKIEENNGRKNLVDEYTGIANIYAKKDNPDRRRNDPKYDYQAEPDHIVPLKQIHEQFKGNYALSKDDRKAIANADYNLALTSGYINGRKLGDTSSEFINKQDKLKAEGKDHVELSDETRKRMLEMEANSQKNINTMANKKNVDNLVGKGEADRDELKKAYAQFEKENGRKPKDDIEREYINKKVSAEKTQKIHKQLGTNAVEQSKEYMTGNIILYIIKPLYYEVKDIVKYGMKDGVGASSVKEAFMIRFGRIKKYVISNAANFFGDSVLEFVKSFVSSLIEGVISLFVGIFKNVLKILKEGIRIFVQSAKVLFGSESSNMSSAQKGDAIIKIVGGGVIAISGVLIDTLLSKVMHLPESISVVLSTMLSGIASCLFMYLLDKADLFSVKAENRRNRIIEIYEERINDIELAKSRFDMITIETLKKQKLDFETITEGINTGIAKNDINKINEGLYKMADFMKVELSYTNTEEFVEYFDSTDVITI